MLTLLVKYSFIIFCATYSYCILRDIRLDKKSNLMFISLTVLTATVFTASLFRQSITIRIIVMLVTSYVLITLITNTRLYLSFLIILVSYGLSFVFYILSNILVIFVFLLLYKTADAIPYSCTDLLIGILQLVFTLYLLKIKRFRSGLKTIIRSQNSILGIYISVIFMLYIILMTSYKNTLTISIRVVSNITASLISLLLLYYWRHRITQTYREKLRLANEKSLEDEISNQKETIVNLEADNARLSQIVHKDNKIILAMLTAVNEHLENASALTPEELAVRGKELSAQLQDMAKDRQGILSTQTEQANALPKCGLHTIDGMLSFMESRAKENGITYKLQIEGNSKEIASNAIQEADLLHLLGDLIDNAIIAAKHTNDKKEILIHLGRLQNHFLLEISDSGIPFSLDTYQSFGNEQYTTHGDDGGSGIGLMDIWKLKKKYKASLHIYEYEEGESIFTKKLTFIFDRKNHFLLQTPRHKEASHTVIRGDLYIFPNRSDASMN